MDSGDYRANDELYEESGLEVVHITVTYIVVQKKHSVRFFA